MALAGLSFTVAILSQLQNHGKSLKKRLASYKKNPGLFEKIDKSVSRVIASASKVADMFKDNPDTLSKQVCDLVYDSLVSVNEALVRMERIFASFDAMGLTEGGSSDAPRPTKRSRSTNQFRKATSKEEKMKEFDNEISNIEQILQFQLLLMSTGRS